MSSFSGLQTDLSRPPRPASYYFVFDLLYSRVSTSKALPFSDRKGSSQAHAVAPFRLDRANTASISRRVADRLLRHACQMGLEGIVSKRADRPTCRPRRTLDQVEMRLEAGIRHHRLRPVDASKQRHRLAGARLTTTASELVHAGRAGTGFSDDVRSSCAGRSASYRPRKPKFKRRGRARHPRRTSNGSSRNSSPRSSSRLELRPPAPPGLLQRPARRQGAKEIVLETGKTSRPARSSADLSGVRLTHPERFYGPRRHQAGPGRFLRRHRDWILPHVTGRVLSLVRCPSGVAEQVLLRQACLGRLELRRRARRCRRGRADAGDPRPRGTARAGPGGRARNSPMGLARSRPRADRTA